jgi:uncharacterized membrane protein
MSIAVSFHLLSAVIWIGGMFFAYMVLRPASAAVLDPPARLKLWSGVFDRFFPWVWAAAVTLIVSGYVMVLGYLGGFSAVGVDIHLMQGIGIVMVLLFMHVYFVPYRRLKAAVGAEDWASGAKNLNQIRRVVAINTVLGLLLVVIGAGGRYV